MKQAQDAIYIVTLTAGRAEQIRQAIDLRDYDEILCVPYDNAALLLKANPPVLAIIDTEGQLDKLATLMSQVPPTVKSIVLSDQFNDDVFLTCHDPRGPGLPGKARAGRLPHLPRHPGIV